MKKPVILFHSIFWLFLLACNTPEKKNTSAHSNRIDSLMSLMTLEEKIGQLNLPAAGDINTGLAENKGIIPKIREGKVGGLFNIRTVEKIKETQRIAVEESRLKIPLIFAMDVIHGYKTVFPIPLALASSWDMELIEKTARLAAKEATADGIALTFSPMVDLSRDPRWGRNAEGIGEDPYLGSEIARAMVRGYQGDDLSSPETMMSCVKHFALYGASEAGRDYNTVDMSRLKMYNVYLPPYHAAVEEGAGSIMTSFNEIDGIPATGNRWLLTELLRNQWGFDGFVVSDYTGVSEMVSHGVGDFNTVSAMALQAGLDMDMVSEGFTGTLQESLASNLVTVEDIDRACRRILEAKFKLGLFDDPYRYCDIERSKTEIFTSENRQFARETAAQSFVLLKNEKDILPLRKTDRIALIGPMASNVENVSGTWSVAGDFKKSISLAMGLKNAGINFTYARGCNLYNDPDLEARVSVFGKNTYRDPRPADQMIREAVQLAKNSDVIVAAMGEGAETSGESSSLTSIELPQAQRDLLIALKKTGKPIVLVLFNGRPLAIKWENDNIPAILDVWFGGSETGDAIADVLFGDVNPSGKLPMTFPQTTGQIPIYYNHKNTGRPLPEGQWFQKFKTNYLDVSNDPLYPFGYGLSYTNFSFGELAVSGTSLKGDQTLKVIIPVTNRGRFDGQEVIQLYIRDLVGSITRPVKELKSFQKVAIQADKTETVVFEIGTDDLRFYNSDLEYDWEAGEFEIMVGNNSRDVQSVTINWSK